MIGLIDIRRSQLMFLLVLTAQQIAVQFIQQFIHDRDAYSFIDTYIFVFYQLFKIKLNSC